MVRRSYSGRFSGFGTWAARFGTRFGLLCRKFLSHTGPSFSVSTTVYLRRFSVFFLSAFNVADTWRAWFYSLRFSISFWGNKWWSPLAMDLRSS